MQQLDAVLQHCGQVGQAKHFKRRYIFEVVIFFLVLNTQILVCGPDGRGMMNQPETRLEGREDSKTHSLNSINC